MDNHEETRDGNIYRYAVYPGLIRCRPGVTAADIAEVLPART